VNLGKLTKRLRKELLANPKQAAVLAVVCAVAVWFWSPLLMKWYRGKASAASPTPAPAETNNDKKEEPKHTWLEVMAWRKADALTRSAVLSSESRDPFQPLQPPALANTPNPQPGQTQPTTEEDDPRPIELEKLGFTLDAIVYGGSRRLAQINGQTVRENEQVTLNAKEDDEEFVAHVMEIRRDEVLLDIRGISLRLKLQPKLLSRGEVVERTNRVGQGSP
jgi:hypothetical protein